MVVRSVSIGLVILWLSSFASGVSRCISVSAKRPVKPTSLSFIVYCLLFYPPLRYRAGLANLVLALV